MSCLFMQFCCYTGSFGYRFNEKRNAYTLSYVGVFVNLCSTGNVLLTAILLSIIDETIVYPTYLKFALIFLISFCRLVKSRRYSPFFTNSEYLDYFKLMSSQGKEYADFCIVQGTCVVLMCSLVMERFFLPFRQFTNPSLWQSVIFPILLQTTTVTVYLTVSLQICLISYIVETELKSLLAELEGILNACVMNNNDIFLVSTSLTGLASNYKQNLQMRQLSLKGLIRKYLKLMTFIKDFNQEYRHELFLLYIFYLQCAEDFLTYMFHLPSTPNTTPIAVFLCFKLFNILIEFVYLSYRCYRVKKQYQEFEFVLINYDNLCEQGMFNLINVLLHKLNINRIKFSALDFVHIDMELFSRTIVGLSFLMLTLITEMDRGSEKRKP